MKTLLILICALMISAKPSAELKDCDIEAFYTAYTPERGMKVLTSGGELAEAEEILKPTTVNEGKYTLRVTRAAGNLYKVEGQNLYIETRYCYEYARQVQVALIVESRYGYSKGKIIF